MDFIKKIKDEFSSSSSGGQTQDWYITVVRGEGIKDDDFLSRSDPYLKVEFGGKHFRTRTMKNERSPAWNETFHFQLKSNQAQDIVLTLMDDDIGFDDHLGRGIISKGDLPSYSNQEKALEVPIKKNDQITGLIHLRAKLVDNSMQQQQQSNVSTFQTLPSQQQSYQSSNLPNQQTSQFSSGYQQQPMSYGGLNTQPQQYQSQPYQGQQYQGQPYQGQQQAQSSQQYSSSQFQQDPNTNQQQHHHQHQSNDNYYGRQ